MRARRLRAERGKDGVTAVGFGCRFRVSGRLGFRGVKDFGETKNLA
jgi:hypothetical protein